LDGIPERDSVGLAEEVFEIGGLLVWVGLAEDVLDLIELAVFVLVIIFVTVVIGVDELVFERTELFELTGEEDDDFEDELVRVEVIVEVVVFVVVDEGDIGLVGKDDFVLVVVLVEVLLLVAV
jgi:hypothetical protein